MRAPVTDPARTLNVGRYAAAGIMALALSLAGVLGGHQLIGAAFGVGDGEEAFALARGESLECPPDLRAMDACDYDGDAAPPEAHRDDEDSCGGGEASPPPVARGPKPPTIYRALLAERR